jgi:hypothetical protein
VGGGVNPVAGAALMAVSLAVIAVGVWVIRPRTSLVPFVITLCVAGAGLGLGALMFMEDVGTASWFLTPIVMAVLTTAHTVAMVAGDGPLRT